MVKIGKMNIGEGAITSNWVWKERELLDKWHPCPIED